MPPTTSKTGGVRGFLIDVMLFLHHTFFATLTSVADCDMSYAARQLDIRLEKYPNSFMLLALKARVTESQRNSDEAENQIIRVIQAQKDWKNIVHCGIWDLGFCKASQGKWKEAAGCFDVLYRESTWCPAVLAYLKAVFLYHTDRKFYSQEIDKMMSLVLTLTKKSTGIPMPMDVSLKIDFAVT
jgi:hypothetical protein